MYAIQNRYFPPYTYVFEDNWPKYGDFDLNDIVLTLKTDQPKQIQMVIWKVLNLISLSKQLVQVKF